MECLSLLFIRLLYNSLDGQFRLGNFKLGLVADLPTN